ncbi:MAG: PC4/YdbC family ssDNA-binding protein [Nanoarchaeota archaeon]|nr:PC4/YdbC family ssDNA-binding protein [Nanoarchaeota archaeon]
MEKEIGKIKKNETTNIIVRVDEYKGKKGLTIREFVTSEKYTGFTKSGTRIPADEYLNFRDMINSVNLDDLTSSEKEAKEEETEVKEESEEESEEAE